MKFCTAMIALALATALLACPAAADRDHDNRPRIVTNRSNDEHFKKCFCWDNRTRDFCNGNDWHDSEDCSQWQWAALWWVVPLVILAVFYILYPFFLLIGRLMCNCCGGRNPSFDCCCPDSKSERRFPGYTKCTVIFTKVCYALCTAGYIALAVLGIVATAHWHNAADDMLSSLVDTSATMLNDLKLAESSLRTLSDSTPALTNASVVSSVAAAYSAFEDRQKRIVNVEDEGNDDITTSPSQFAFTAMSLPLIMLLVGLIVMACSTTGAFVTILGGVFSLTTSLLVLAATAFMVLSVASGALCRTWDETAVPIVVGSIETVGGCHNTALLHAVNDSAIAYDRYTRNASAPLCVDIALVCASAGLDCSASPCGRADVTMTTGKKYLLPDVSPIQTLVATTNNATQATFAKCSAGSGCNTTVASAAGRVVDFSNKQGRSVTTLVDRIFPQTFECKYVRDVLRDVIRPQLCRVPSGVQRNTGKVAVFLGSLVAVATVALFFYMRGAKRFAQQIPADSDADKCPCACHDDDHSDYVDRRPVCFCRCGIEPYGQPAQGAAQLPQELQPVESNVLANAATDDDDQRVEHVVVGTVVAVPQQEPQARVEFEELPGACVSATDASPSKGKGDF